MTDPIGEPSGTNPYIAALSSDIDNDLDVIYQGGLGGKSGLVILRNWAIEKFKKDFPALGKLIFSQVKTLT